MSSKGGQSRQPYSLWKSVLALEPGLVVHMTAAITVFMSVQDFMLEKACRVNFDYGDTVCDALKAKNAGDKYESQEKEVQKLIGSVMMWRTFLENAFPILLVFLIGAWSDKYGRKGPMLFVVGAFILQNIMLIGCATLLEKSSGAWTVAVVSSLIVSLAGNQACFMVCAFSYVSDNTPVESRTTRNSITHCCIFLGITVGLAAGGALSHSGLPFENIFGIGLALELFSLLYMALMIENQPQPGATKGKSSLQIISELFDFRHVRDAFSSVLKPRPNNGRTKLLALLLAHACAFMPMMGEMGVLYLFTRLQFDWDGGAFGKFMTYKTVLGFVSNFVSLGLLSSALKLSDPAQGIVAAGGNLAASLLFVAAAQAGSPSLMYIAPLATLLSGAAMIVPRSTISKLIPTGELGKVNSFIGSLESIIPLVAAGLYTKIYTAAMEVLPGSFFLLSAALTLPPMAIFWWFMCQEEEVKELKKKK